MAAAGEVKVICVRVTGGEAGGVASLAPKVGPLGLSPKKVGDDIAKDTKEWKGLRITVQLTIQNRQATIKVIPSAAALVIRALKEKTIVKGAQHKGNISLDDVIAVAKIMRPRSMARTMAGTVKEILGTVSSVGATCDKRKPRDVQADIDAGIILIEDYEAPPAEE